MIRGLFSYRFLLDLYDDVKSFHSVGKVVGTTKQI